MGNISEIKTGIDRFLELINAEGETKVDIAAKKLGVPAETIEIWAEVLQQDNLIDIGYDGFGKMTAKPKAPEGADEKAKKSPHPAEQKKETRGRGFSILKNMKEKSVWKKRREINNKKRYLSRLKTPVKNKTENIAPKKENIFATLLKRLGMKKQK